MGSVVESRTGRRGVFVLVAIAAAVLGMLLVPAAALAEDADDEWSDYKWSVSMNTNKVIIHKYNGSATNLVIPTEMGGYLVGEIASDAFKDCTSLHFVNIPDSVYLVDSDAFRGCTSLEEVYVTQPSSLTTVEDDAFRDCTSLKTVELGAYVTEVDDSAFRGCSSLESVSMGNEVTSIGDWAFYGCTSLTDFTLPSSLQYIGSHAFENCSSYTNGDLPSSLRSIGEDAFKDCTSLARITVPAGLKSAGSGCFEPIAEGAVISVATQSQKNALRNTYDHDTTTVEARGDGEEGGGFMYSRTYSLSGKSGVEIDAYTGTETDVVIPSTINGSRVVSIGSGAFEDCTRLTSVTIPDTVESVDGFEGCTSLASVTLPNSVSEIDSYAFSGCTSLASIEIPDSVTTIGTNAFRGCSALAEVTIPDSITTIAYGAFGGTALTSVEIPDSVTTLGGFDGCTSLVSVAIPDSVKTVSAWAFDGCSALTSVTIPDSVTEIGSSAFSGCTSLASVTLSKSITEIGWFTFDGCSSLASIEIPNSVTTVGGSAFRGCSAFTSVTIPDSVTEIVQYAFEDCTSLASVYVPASVVTFGYGCFLNLGADSVISVDNSTQALDLQGTYTLGTTTVVTRNFADTNGDTPHLDDVLWLAEQGISTGYPDGTFRPYAEVARCDMAAFLYRLAGSPEFDPDGASASFSDVTPQTDHYREVVWLAARGISTGWDNGDGTYSFRPYASVARCDMAAFLYRLAGSPDYEPSAEDLAYFSDVDETTPHWREVLWLAHNGVSAGWTESDGTHTFRNYATVARCDMAAFMHRMVTNGLL